MSQSSPNIERMTRDLAALVSIPSQNPYDEPPKAGYREQEVADFLEQRMREIGLATGRREVAPGRANLWGRIAGSGGGPALMLAGHMDTVGADGFAGDAFGGHVAGGRLVGRGACDMKAALSVFLEVARLVKARAAPLAGDLLLMYVADEEHKMIGSKDAGANGPHADFCIVGEPTELAVCPAHKGQVCLEITTNGRAVHSSMPERGDNAIARMNQVLSALADYPDWLMKRPAHPLLGHARMSPVMIGGGQSHSEIPERCRLLVDRRTLPGETTQTVRDELVARLSPALHHLSRGSSPGPEPSPGAAAFTVSAPMLDIAPLDTPLDCAVVTSARAAAARIANQPDLNAFPGGTDAPNFGCPGIICGPGSLAQAHTASEYVELAQLEKAAAIYLDVIDTLCG